MSIPQVLEVAIGLILIYYIMGSMVSLVTQWINEAFETRAVALERYLKKIVGDANLGDLVDLPQLRSLRPIRYKGPLSVISSTTIPKRIEKVPVTTLVDAYFDIAGLTGNKDLNLLQLAELVDKLPESEGKQAFIKWINQGVTNIEDLRKRTTAYFSGLMDQAAAGFKANARSFVIMLSIIITVLFGTDSIQIAKALWINAELRAVANLQAQQVVSENGPDASLDDLISQLGSLSIRIGWWQTERPAANAQPMDLALFVGLKVLGLAITAAAVSQGSSFWYDLLKKLTSPATSTSTSSSGGSTSSASSSSSG